MKFRRIKAVFKKQILDAAFNTGILIQFLIYPFIVLLMVIAMPKNTAAAVVVAMSTMFTGMVPLLTVNNIIREDKSTNTLRMMIMSTVKPLEYLIGITAYILFASVITALIFGLLGGLGGFSLLLFIGVMILGIGTTLLLGSAMAVQASSQAGAGSFIILVSMMNGFLPMLGAFNDSIRKVSQFWYTQQINGLIAGIFGGNAEKMGRSFIIIGVNFLLFFILFILAYKRNKFYREK